MTYERFLNDGVFGMTTGGAGVSRWLSIKKS